MSGVQLALTISDHEDLVKRCCWKRASDCCINQDHPQTNQRTLDFSLPNNNNASVKAELRHHKGGELQVDCSFAASPLNLGANLCFIQNPTQLS
jgi:hypothetical protein